MNQPVTTAILALLTLLSALGSLIAIRRLRARSPSPARERTLTALCAAIMVISGGDLVARWVMHGAVWQPLHAHVDGLLLIGTLVAAATLFIRLRPRMYGLSAFSLPLLTLINAWAICASAWTYRPFQLESLTAVWSGLHLVGVYLGTLCFVLAAASGAMYLYVQARLKRKDDPAHMGRLASLETLEKQVVGASTVGFAVLTIGLVAGVVVYAARPEAMGSAWWAAPKVILALLAWLAYGLVINVRFTATFRGSRAAWLSIAGLALLLATYAVVSALPPVTATDAPPSAAQQVQAPHATEAPTCAS